MLDDDSSGSGLRCAEPVETEAGFRSENEAMMYDEEMLERLMKLSLEKYIRNVIVSLQEAIPNPVREIASPLASLGLAMT